MAYNVELEELHDAHNVVCLRFADIGRILLQAKLRLKETQQMR